MRSKYQVLTLALLLSACATQKKEHDKSNPNYQKNLKAACSVKEREVPLIGEAETITIDGVGKYKSRIDTGAKTVSINAMNIKKYVHEGEDWVSFKLVSDNGTKKSFKKKIQKVSKIRSASNSHERYFVLMDLVVEGKKIEVLANLNDRSRMTYKLLIGRNLLRGNYNVDSGSIDLFKSRASLDSSFIESVNCSESKKLIEIGTLEKIKIDGKYKLKSRIDTGASRTSIHAYDIKKMKKKGKTYLRFKTQDDKDKEIIVEKRLLGRVPVTSATSTKETMRYLVSYKLGLGENSKSYKVSLVDRRGLKFKLLIGRDFINNMYEVDTSKTYIFKK
jgi:ribosomal protein S6--L-glutamate ligase